MIRTVYNEQVPSSHVEYTTVLNDKKKYYRN